MPGRVRTPLVQQMERTECGAACLGMVLGHHGLFLSLEDLRVQCGISRDGSRAGNIVRAARRLNLDAEGFEITAAGAGELSVPFVAFWNFNHFVTVEGLTARHAFINDPALGRKRIPRGEFDRHFSGVALTFAPTPAFKPGGVKPSVLAGVKQRFEDQRTAILFILSISIAMAVPGILVPNFTRLFVDNFLVRKYEDWLIPILAAMAGATLLQCFLTWLQQHYLLRLETRMSVATTGAMIRKILRLPIAFFGQRNASEIAVRGTQTEALAQLATGTIGTAILALPAILFFAIIMLAYDLKLGVLALMIAGVDFAILALLADRLSERNQAVMIQQSRVNAAQVSGLRMITEYRAAGADRLLFDRIVGLKTRQENLNAPLQHVRLMLQAMPIAIAGIGTAAVLTLGGTQVMAGAITVGLLIAFQGLMASFMAPVSQLVGMGQQIQNARAHISQIDDIMLYRQCREFTVSPAAQLRDLVPLAGAVEASALSFGYSPLEPALLQDIDFSIAPGEWLAVVGRSGSGKSTLGKLIAGIEEPWSGEVRLDGRPLMSVPRRLTRNSVAMVDQTITFMDGTYRDNIALWDPTLPEEKIVAAAKMAGIHDLILAEPNGYDTKLSEDAGNLSGGQRALLDLARALAVRPSVLLLDESTAALDAMTEDRVMERLRELGATTILIAHRPKTVRLADRILVMDRGRIAGIGTHDELMQGSPVYRTLMESV
jgi:NHLM bacteriocin system ABC transporter peptidase/ATP-binding protein